ncbi:hypothetical protein L1887_29303 [Cichorium endivia]|nr:hypothetical protein L1887_29303 [Cichorium endivia]
MGFEKIKAANTINVDYDKQGYVLGIRGKNILQNDHVKTLNKFYEAFVKHIDFKDVRCAVIASTRRSVVRCKIYCDIFPDRHIYSADVGLIMHYRKYTMVMINVQLRLSLLAVVITGGGGSNPMVMAMIC